MFDEYDEYVFSEDSSSDNIYYTNTDYNNWSLNNMENYFDISVKKCTINDISLDHILEILFHLSPSDILNFSKTNKEYYDLCQDNALWNHFILKEHGDRKEVFDKIIYNNKKELFFIISEMEIFFKNCIMENVDINDPKKEISKYYDLTEYIHKNDINNIFKEFKHKTKHKYRIPNSFFKIKAVRECNSIYLCSHEIYYIPSILFNFNHLVELNIINCDISYIPSNIKNLSSLVLLNLTNNKLDHFPISITEITNLQYLLLSNNNISTIPHKIKNMSKLLFLDISRNNFLIFPNCLIELKKLKCLCTFGNPVGNIDSCDKINKYCNIFNRFYTNNNLGIHRIYSNIYQFDGIIKFKVEKCTDKIITTAISESGWIFTRELHSDDCLEYFESNINEAYVILNNKRGITFYRTKLWTDIIWNNNMVYQIPLVKIN